MLGMVTTSKRDFRAKNEAEILEECLALIAEGDKTALEELYARTRPQIYGFALSLLKNSHDAEDVLHDTLVAVWQSASSYRPKGKPLAWILTVTRHLCFRLLKGRGRTSSLPEEDFELPQELRYTMAADEKLLLEACLNHLADEERQIVMLHAITGFRHWEIASLLELPLPTVLSKYHRAILKMRHRIQEGGMTV